ncbi:CAP domain-containing protein [uncultured Ruminococcus sp.]|uniref:CAP domain-containing protein n=1 Tax=uncultured Ruminococcus sp. TaxID=165186 RepID=UPI00261BBBC1|nr:CAP domain-containing protein [uncultured Ruminococcus sp.]
MSIVRRYTIRIAAVIVAAVMSVCLLSNTRSYTNADTDGDYSRMAEEILWLTNEARIEAGLQPLKAVPYLNDISNVRSRECIFKFSHERPEPVIMPDGTEEYRFFTVIDESLVPWTKAAENIAAGSSDPVATFEQWKSSDNHWKSILNPAYTHIGVSVSYDPNSQYKYYWEQIFVRVDGSLNDEYLPERYQTVPKSSGDINGDGEINTFDLITINRYLAGRVVLNDLQIESADMLRDNTVTSADVAVLKKYILGEYKTLPVTMEMIMNGDYGNN